MSTFHYWLYGTLGFVLVALGVWRIGGRGKLIWCLGHVRKAMP